MKLILILLVAVVLAGCVAEAAIYGPPLSYGTQIPAGHQPPPGECRIWYPDRPAGQQPPPQSCHALFGRVPPGAVLVRG